MINVQLGDYKDFIVENENINDDNCFFLLSAGIKHFEISFYSSILGNDFDEHFFTEDDFLKAIKLVLIDGDDHDDDKKDGIKALKGFANSILSICSEAEEKLKNERQTSPRSR